MDIPTARSVTYIYAGCAASPSHHVHTHCRNRMLGVRNDSHFDKGEAEPTAELVKQELKIPHKHPIHHHKQTFKLEWKDNQQK